MYVKELTEFSDVLNWTVVIADFRLAIEKRTLKMRTQHEL
jgi:hypothetical protein